MIHLLCKLICAFTVINLGVVKNHWKRNHLIIYFYITLIPEYKELLTQGLRIC